MTSIIEYIRYAIDEGAAEDFERAYVQDSRRISRRLFPHGVTEAHRAQVTVCWVEVLGGPATYTESLGGYDNMLGLSASRQRRRTGSAQDRAMSIVSESRSDPDPVAERPATRHTSTEPPESSVWDLPDLPPNHHGNARQFGGVVGYLAGVTMLVGRRRDAQLVARRAGLTASDHVVDIGCGPGTAARVAANHGALVTGVDPSRPMLRLAQLVSARRRRPGVTRWVQAAAEHLTLPDGSCTVCWSLASVHHWPDLERGIAEVARVVAPGGRFIALEARTRAGDSGRASHGWTPAQAERFAGLLSEVGFEDVLVENHELGRRRVVIVVATSPVLAT